MCFSVFCVYKYIYIYIYIIIIILRNRRGVVEPPKSVDGMLCPTVHEPESPSPPPVDVHRCSVDDPWYGSIRYRAYVRDAR